MHPGGGNGFNNPPINFGRWKDLFVTTASLFYGLRWMNNCMVKLYISHTVGFRLWHNGPLMPDYGIESYHLPIDVMPDEFFKSKY